MGRRQFEQVVAQAPRISIKQIDLSASTPVTASGGNAFVDVFSSNGTAGRVINMYANIPLVSGSSTGTHKLEIYNQTALGSNRPIYLKLQNNNATAMQIQYNRFVISDAGSFPSSETGQMDAIRSMKFDDVQALRFAYFNNTDLVQAGSRNITMTYEEQETR